MSKRSTRESRKTGFAALTHCFLLALALAPQLRAQSSSITVSVSPATASVPVGGIQQFTATVKNDRHHRGVRWKLSGPGCSGSTCGTLSATSSASGTPITFSAPPNAPNPATVTLTATSVSNTQKMASASLTITSNTALSVTISPKRGGLAVTQSLPITATVLNDIGAAGVTWSASGSACSGTSCGTSAM